MSRFFDDKVLSDDQICEETCENGQVSPESRYNDYRNRLPFHYIEDGENDGYYYWTYGATMELSIILSDDVACGEDPQPAYDIFVDDKLSETSKNPVQNKVITEALNGKVDKSTEKTVFDQAYIKTAAGDNSRRDISIEQLPLTLVERDIQGHVMTSKADSEGQAVPYEQLEQRVPAGGKEGQNLTKKSDKDYDVYWADPDDINSIEHITLNGEEVPVENKTAKITVDKSTVGLENIYAQLNENIIKNPEKTYLVWKGSKFPNSSDATFKAPANSTINWGDGTVETFTTASTTRNEHIYTDGINYHLISISGLTTLSYSSFFACDSLIEAVLGLGIYDIGNTVFRRCTNLKKVVCNTELQSIGIETFDYGTIIINNKVNAPLIGTNNFYNTEKIIVPKSAINAYKSAANWSKYVDKIVYEVDSSDLDKAITDLDVDNIAYKNKRNTFTQQMYIRNNNPYLTLGPNSQDEGNLGKDSLTFDYASGTKQVVTTYNRDYLYHYYYDSSTGEDIEAKLEFPTKSGTLALIEDLTAKLDKPTVADSNYKIVTYNGTNSGTLDYSTAPSASSVMQRDADGRAQVVSGVSGNDIVNYSQLDTKYDKTGGTIGGDVVITGDLTVNGTQHINNTENLNVENAMIYSNANGATLATNGGIGIKKNATDVYGIVYDPTSDSVKLGIGKSDANGRFTFNANEGNPVAVRDDSAQLTNNHIIKWDSTNHKLVDSGKSVDDFVNLTDNQTISGIKTFSNAANFKDAISVDGLVTAKAGITTTKIESTTGVGSYDVRSGQFTNGSAENVIKLPQKAGTIALDGDLVTTPITETETVVVDTTTVNFALDAEHDTGMYVSAENAISLGSTQLQWNDGRQKYKVIWDGVEYICYVQATTNPKYKEDGTYTYYDWQILGNGNNKLNCYNKDTNIYPFAITQDRWKNSAEWLIYATTSTAATHTIKVIKVEGTYKKVTPEYQYDYLSMLKNGRSSDTLIHGFSVDDDGMSSGILSGNGNQYINDVPVGDKYDTGVVIFGNGNLVHRYKATGNVLGVTITGYGNALHLKGADCLSPFIAGYKNTITANKGTIHPDAVFGSHNKLTYDGNTTYGLNIVGGNSHTIKNAALSLITGLGNTVECLTANDYIYSNIVGGEGNTVNHDRVIVGGRGNTSDRHGQFIAGNYSAANEKALVKIGNGTKDARANAFEVLDDNRAKVFGTPTENNDVLRYQDTAVEVETSLMGA